MTVPPEYVGREQTWLKHRVLKEYLAAWSHKLASTSRTRRVKLWFVDCFSGPWQARAGDLSDTSILIGLQALQRARATWEGHGSRIELGAVFVEKHPQAFAELKQVVADNAQGIDAHAIHGNFGDQVATIDSLLGGDAAFLWVDPTGWDGAAMNYIAPLAVGRWRDVMVNVMFDHINRFKDDPRAFLRRQMKAFFGLAEADLEPGLSEPELLRLYRTRLREVCGVSFAADLAVPHPTVERTKFRLVVGGHNPSVLDVFRQVERRVMGTEAAPARTEAKERERFDRDGQFALFSPTPPREDLKYAAERRDGIDQARALLPTILRDGGSMQYRAVWPAILQECHITKADLSDLIDELRREGGIAVDGLGPRERRVKDQHTLRLVAGG